MTKKTSVILLVTTAAVFVGGCTLSDIWKCIIGFSNCGLGSANQSTVVTHVDPPVIPCRYSKVAEPINVTVSGSADMNPPIQYCFVKITGAQNWCSTPQAFGPGTTTLSFTGFVPDNADYEVVVALTPDTAVARIGDPNQATVIKKVQMNLTMAGTKKCPLIEYNCMAGYDIRGPSDTTDNNNLYKYARKRFFEANTELVFVEHNLSLQAQVFSSMYDPGGLLEYLQKTWIRRFLYDSTTADFGLIAIQDCVNRKNFFGSNDPLGDSAVGLSGAIPFDTLGRNTGSWSLVFKATLDSVLIPSSRQTGYNRTAVHELGHALAALPHPDKYPDLHNGGANANCVMSFIEYYRPAPGALASGKDKFCNMCKDFLENVNWTQGK